MTCQATTVVLLALVAMLTVATGLACTPALAQTDEELAAGFTAENPNRLVDLYVADGGYICQQINIIGNDCHDPNGAPVSCCLYYASPAPAQLQGPGCWEYAPSLVQIQQVGKGYCCAHNLIGGGPPGFVRFEDQTKPCEFCGGKTPGPNECCTRNRDIIPAYPVTDPSQCPDLRQDPDHPPSVTDPPCGSEDMVKKGRRLPPQNPTGAPFYIGCAAHDRCYSTCGSNKAVCDQNLKVQLAAICDEYFVPLLNNANEVEADQIQFAWAYCKGFSWVYYEAVTSRGASAFDDAQAKVCRCCIGGSDAPLPL